MKKCYECGETKPLESFIKNVACRDGWAGKCKTCAKQYSAKWAAQNPKAGKSWRAKNPDRKRLHDRSSKLKALYGINVDQYDKMVYDQGGRCLVCKEIPLSKKGKVGLHVDHDHLSGRIRGLLCHGCNVALGHLKENEDIVRNLLSYIQKHVKETVTDAQPVD